MKISKTYKNLSIKGFLEIANAYTLPTTDGTFGYVMVTDGVGNVTWANPETLAITTDGVTEGSNLYYTDERVDDRVSSLIIDGTGLTWTYDDIANTFKGDVSLAPFSTTDLVEGVNLYYTGERVDDRVSGLIQNGTGISWAYTDNGASPGTLVPTISLSPFNTDDLAEGTVNKYFTNEAIDDRVADLIKNGTGLTWTYNDPANTLTGNINLTPFSTTDLVEGTRLYFTDERVDDRVSSLIVDTATITWTYNDIANTLEANAASQPIQVNKAGTPVSTRGILNFIEGPNTTINIVDNGGTLASDITISATTGGPSNPGTLYDILNDGVVIGDADIEHLNFSNKFTVVESPDKYVTVDIALLLSEISDISITSPLADGDTLLYNSTLGIWENGIFINELSELDDVTITTPSTGDYLTYAGAGVWNNSPLPIIPISGGGTGQTTAQGAINALTQVSAATNEYVLTKDTGTGNAIWKMSTAGVSALNVVLGIGNHGTAGQDIILHGTGKYVIDDDLAGPSTSNLELSISATEALIETTGVAGASRDLVIKSNAVGGVILDSPGTIGPHFKARAGSVIVDYLSLATASRTYSFQDLDGTVGYIDQIGGNPVDALIVAPTLSQDGYVIAWNDSLNKYNLIPFGGSITGSGTLNEVTFWSSSSNITSDSGLTFNSVSQIFNVPNLVINGTINISAGAGDGKFLKSDGSGNGSWDDITIGDISDIDTTSAVDGDVLVYGGSPGEWTTQAPRRTWSWNASSSNTSSNVYLKGAGGTFTNKSPYIAPFDCTLSAISASTDGSETWSAEVHVNGSNVGSLSIFTSDSGYASPLNITISAGDKVSFYCNGTSIKGPNITGWFNEI